MSIHVPNSGFRAAAARSDIYADRDVALDAADAIRREDVLRQAGLNARVATRRYRYTKPEGGL